MELVELRDFFVVVGDGARLAGSVEVEGRCNACRRAAHAKVPEPALDDHDVTVDVPNDDTLDESEHDGTQVHEPLGVILDLGGDSVDVHALVMMRSVPLSTATNVNWLFALQGRLQQSVDGEEEVVEVVEREVEARGETAEHDAHGGEAPSVGRHLEENVRHDRPQGAAPRIEQLLRDSLSRSTRRGGRRPGPDGRDLVAHQAHDVAGQALDDVEVAIAGVRATVADQYARVVATAPLMMSWSTG